MKCPKCGEDASGGTFGMDDDDKRAYWMPAGVWKVMLRNFDYAKCFVMGKRETTMHYLAHCVECDLYFPGGLIAKNEVVK